MVSWSDFHNDPRTSYYLCLRQGYACPAYAAYARVKWVDAIVASLEKTPREAAALSGLSTLTHLLGIATDLRHAARRLWRYLFPKSGRASQEAMG